MSLLLVQSCSASKQESSAPLPAIDLYTGYFFRIIDKAMRDGAFRDDVVVRILSAEHGLVKPSDELNYYDRRMTTERADELRDSVVESIAETVITAGVNRVIVNGGEAYRTAVSGLADELEDNVSVSYITGGGNGVMGRQLKSLIRTDEMSVKFES